MLTPGLPTLTHHHPVLHAPSAPPPPPPSPIHTHIHTYLDFPFQVFATCFPTDGRIKRFCRSECPSTDGQTRQWIVVVGGGELGRSDPAPTAAECDKMQSGIRCPPPTPLPSVQNWPSERTCERHDGMSFAVRASLGDSCDVYRPASMTVGGRRGAARLFSDRN